MKLRGLLLAWAACLAPAVACAQLLLTGVSAGSGPAPYTPGAVSFNQTVSLSTKGNAAGVTDSSYFFMSIYVRGSVGNNAFSGNQADSAWSALDADVWGNYSTTGTSETAPGGIFVTDNASAIVGTVRLNLNDTNCNTGGCGANTNHSFQAYKQAAWINTNWTWVIYAADTSVFPQRCLLMLNGVKQTLTSCASVGTLAVPFIMNFNNAQGVGFNIVTQSGAPGAYDLAEAYIDIHTAGLIDSSGNPTFNPALFNNGAPVNFSCAALGTTADWCFRGDKTTFSANQGSATQAFALFNPTTTSSASPLLWNAAYGPAGKPTTRPTFTWVYSSHLTGQNAATTSFPLTVHANLANAIVAGHLLVESCQLEDTTVPFNRGMNISQPGSGGNSWAVLTTTGITFPYLSITPLPSNYAIWWKLADANDVTASGADWTNAPTINWTANANALRAASCTGTDYGPVNQTTPIQSGAAAQYNVASTTPGLPAVTASGAGTLISIVLTAANDGVDLPPSGEELRYRRTDAAGGSASFAMVSDAAIAAGATVAARNSSSTTSHPTVGVSLVIQR